MKKYLCAGILCLSMLAGSVQVYAFEPSSTGTQVTLKFPYTAGEKTLIFVVRHGEDINDNDNVCAVKSVTAGDNGIEFTFNMPSVENSANLQGKINDKYDVYAKGNNGTYLVGSFNYASTESRSNLILAIDNAPDAINDSQNADAIYTILENTDNDITLSTMGMYVEKYRTLTDAADRKKVAQLMFEKIGTNTVPLTEDDIKPAYNVSAGIVLLANGTDGTDVMNICDAVYGGKKYTELSDTALKDWLKEYFNQARNYASIDEFYDAYNTANVLYIVNSARYNDMETTLSVYAQSLGLNGKEGYERYKTAINKVDINKSIVTSLKASPAYSTIALDGVIGKAVTDNSYVSGVVGGTGGSGGGSSGAPVIGTTPSLGSTQEGTAESNTKPQLSDLGEAPWAADAIEKLIDAGIVSGDDKGHFNPNDIVTREQFIKMIVCAAGLENMSAECEFDDVPADAWYYKYVAIAYSHKIAFGINENAFGTGRSLTRQDMAVLAVKAAEKVKQIKEIRQDVTFADDGEMAAYAKDSVSKLYRAGVINGMDENHFSPLGETTRAQAAMIIYNLFLK